MYARFTEEEVQKVPEDAGIFSLFRERDLVYIGRTPPRATLRNELLHALKMAMAADMLATHFTWEATAMPKTRAAEELRSYFETWGRLPLYNQPHGWHFRPGAQQLQR
jgi:hypothetical protein